MLKSKAKVTTSQVITARRGKDHEARAPDPGRGVALNAPKRKYGILELSEFQYRVRQYLW